MLGISIVPPQRTVTGFGNISSGNISIGRDGLVVDGKKVSAEFNSLDDLVDMNVVLGSGISGTVRKYQCIRTGNIYAMKIMKLENSEEFIEKKLLELKTLHASSHPNIVSFHGAFYVDGALHFILEFMDRGTISDLQKQCTKIPENILSKLTRELLLGLEYLHKKLHLIHRDIKPQNILLSHEGAVKITDFGVSGEIASTAAFAKTFVGTINYMSPSRIKGNEHSAKSDIWSLGLVILECATGVYPYGVDDPNNVFSRLFTIVNSPPPTASPDQFSPEFCNFISLCLQKEEENLPDSTKLLTHPWLTKYDNDGQDLKKWTQSILG